MTETSAPKTSEGPEWAQPRTPGTPVVTPVETLPAFEALAPLAKRTIKAGEPLRFAFDIIVEPTSEFGKRAYVPNPMRGGMNFEIFCDEGKVIGGTELAPSPLAYFTAGVAFCLMTHITGFLRFTDLKVRKLRLEMRANYLTTLGHINKGNQGEGGCDSFETFVLIDSDEPPERIAEFVKICERACIASQTIANAIPTSVNVMLNGARI